MSNWKEHMSKLSVPQKHEKEDPTPIEDVQHWIDHMDHGPSQALESVTKSPKFKGSSIEWDIRQAIELLKRAQKSLTMDPSRIQRGFKEEDTIKPCKHCDKRMTSHETGMCTKCRDWMKPSID